MTTIKKHYQELGRKRWENVSQEERKEAMSKAGKASWEKMTPDEREAKILKMKLGRQNWLKNKNND